MSRNLKSKISKKEFIRGVAKDNKMTIAETSRAYDAIVEGIHKAVSEGNSLSLTGFGVFYLHKHKGHPVQFEGSADVKDYIVFKFSASDVFNKRLREEYDRGEVIVGKR